VSGERFMIRIREQLRRELENELTAIVEKEAVRQVLIKKLVVSICPLVKKSSTNKRK
jgi:DNA topoisomerase IA